MALTKAARAIREHVKTAVNCTCEHCEADRDKKGVDRMAPDPAKLYDVSRPQPAERQPSA